MESSNFGDSMTQFYADNNFQKGGTPGAGFVGKVIREIISPHSLDLLSMYLGEQGNVYIKYLSSIRELYSVCVQSDLKDDFEERVQNFRNAFEAAHQECDLSETVKVHTLSCHIREFLSFHGHTLAHLSDEPIETLHGKFRFFERKSNYLCRKNLVGRYKRSRTKASMDTWNMKKWGHSTSTIKKKKRNKMRKKNHYFEC